MDDKEIPARYARDGHVTVRALVGPGVVHAALKHLAHLRTQPGGDLASGIVTAAVDDPSVLMVTTHPRVEALVGMLLGGNPELFGCTYLTRAARVGLPALWHQDGHPWRARLRGRAALTIWIALDEVTPDNGCLRVIPGSYALAAQPLRPNTRTPNVFGHEIDPALVDLALVEPSAAVDVLLAPGDASVLHPNLVHGSGPNRSDRPRAALALRFAARDEPDPQAV